MKLEAQWVVGFTDGRGRFHVEVAPQPGTEDGVQVRPEFSIVRPPEDAQLLHALKAYFGVGVVRNDHDGRLAYRVRNVRHLHDVICPFFMKHTLRSRTHVAFLKFRRVVRMMMEDAHHEPDGLEAIRRIAAEMDVGRSR